VIVFCGLPGAGKTSLASRIAERSGFSLISSDRVRKEIAGLDPKEKRHVGVGEGIYAETWTQKTYHRMFEMAHEVLRRGRGVILDATFLKADYRWPFVRLAEDLNLPTLFLECRVPGDVVRDRMKRREAEPGEISDATWDVHVKMQEAFEPFQNWGTVQHAIVLTDGSLDAVLMRAEALIKEGLLDRRWETLLAAACD
jgi:predicted kinase